MNNWTPDQLREKARWLRAAHTHNSPLLEVAERLEREATLLETLPAHGRPRVDEPVAYALWWLKSAIDCPAFCWDVDQREMATEALDAALSKLSGPKTFRSSEVTYASVTLTDEADKLVPAIKHIVEAYCYGQFSDDANWPQAKSTRDAIRVVANLFEKLFPAFAEANRNYADKLSQEGGSVRLTEPGKVTVTGLPLPTEAAQAGIEGFVLKKGQTLDEAVKDLIHQKAEHWADRVSAVQAVRSDFSLRAVLIYVLVEMMTEMPKCRGISDSKCDYLANCGVSCNKCGRVHDGQPTRPKDHDLYTDADKNRPEAICDANGSVVLSLCKRCGRAEAELDEPCTPRIPQPRY